MSNQNTNTPDHDEIISMLPWFVNRTLEGDQRNAVSSHIASCDECQREIQFLESLNESVQDSARNSYDSHADVDKSFANVMDRIDADSEQGNVMASGVSWLKQLGEVFKIAPTLSLPQWSATAMAGILVAVLGFQLFHSQSSDDYTVLSSSEIDDPAMRLSVQRSTAANQDQVQSVIEIELEKLGHQIAIERDADGTHVIVFKDSVDVTELGKLITDLEKDARIERVQILP